MVFDRMFRFVAGLSVLLLAGAAQAQVHVTEWMYSGPGGEFVELTNTGDEPVDLAGWSYDDDSATPGVFDLSGFGEVQPGESAVFTESDAEAFRGEWGLCAGVKILGGYTNNLGRNDQINIFDAGEALADRLTYGDETFPGSIRTQNASGWVSAAGLGVDDVFEWTLSTVGDGEDSSASSGGAIGSPGKSTRATVPYDPCDGGGPGTPTIAIDQSVVVGSIGDPTNPTALLTVSDPDHPVEELVITVASANGGVLPAANVMVVGTGEERIVGFEPVGRGTSLVSFTVMDPDENEATITMTFAASNQAPGPSGRYHHHISDASSALDVGDGYMLLVNDETNTIFLHHQEISGLPVKTWTFTPGELGTSSEIDFESMARLGDLVVLSGSHGNSRSGAARPERRTLVGATITGFGAGTELAFLGRYNGLWTDLRSWDASDGHGLGPDALGFVAGTAPGVEPNPPNGFNIEALEFAPDAATLYLGFRAPTIEVEGTFYALLVPVLNVDEIVDGVPAPGPALFGDPIFLDLDGRSIRALRRNEHDEYLISAGPSPQNETWALYTWDGDPAHAAQLNRLLPDEDMLTGGVWEGIAYVPHPLVAGAEVRVVTDSGDTNFYGTGPTKDLPQPYQKSYSQLFGLEGEGGGGAIRITEWMYSGPDGEFIELTNVGGEPVSLAGWSYDDDGATPGVFDLSGLGEVQPGESVVLTESDAEAFRSGWGLCAGAKVLGGYTNGLGRNDQINIFDADGEPVDVLTYGDEDFPGSIRTQDASGWVSAAGLGADDVYEWTLSVVDDGEGSSTSTGGAVGSPGKSTRATEPYDPCGGTPEYTLTVIVQGNGQGSVAGDGIDCPEQSCVETYEEGTQVTLTATPDGGSSFAGFGGDCSGTDPCVLTVDGNKQVTAAFAQPPTAGVYITEWMYSGPGGEFIELTNIGDEPIDLAGWSYDDDSATPGVFDLSGFGEVRPGESVVFTESEAEAFRSEWGLCAGVKILGGYTNNIGRNDQINIFDAGGEPVDVLTYGDQTFPGSIRTQDASGWVSEAGLGADSVYEWTLSTVGDGEDSDASIGGAVGSPGRSTRASVPYDPCNGGAASLAFAPSSLDFGDVEVGDTSGPMAATLTNSGGAEATGLVFSSLEGGFAADTGACGTNLPAGASCEVMVTFTPAEPGPAAATLHVESAESAAADLDLIGTGVAEGIVTPVALEVDTDELNSDGNEVFEPGEIVEVAPAWRNDGTTPQSLSGEAADLTGPEGATYTLAHADADYGTLDPAQTVSCLETGVCYQVSVDDPAVRPAPHWEATFEETLSDSEQTTKTWTLHIGDSFVDVPRTNLFYPSVETLLHHGVTGGCTDTEYCPTANNTRDQMPVFVLRAVEGTDYEPPACVEGAEVFHDVAADNVFCPWIQELANRGVVSGCGGDNYCPNAPVTRAQMAIFLLRTLEGSDYEPPACAGMFVDVPCSSLFADWIEELFAREITGGCSNQPLRYCPANPVNREQMAAFIGKAFELALYGP